MSKATMTWPDLSAYNLTLSITMVQREGGISAPSLAIIPIDGTDGILPVDIDLATVATSMGFKPTGAAQLGQPMWIPAQAGDALALSMSTFQAAFPAIKRTELSVLEIKEQGVAALKALIKHVEAADNDNDNDNDNEDATDVGAPDDDDTIAEVGTPANVLEQPVAADNNEEPNVGADVGDPNNLENPLNNEGDEGDEGDEDAERWQVPYQPHSAASIPILTVPRNLQAPTSDALRRIELLYEKTIDAFVAEQLGWSEEKLALHLNAEQVDGVALGIHAYVKGEGLLLGDATGTGKGRILAALARYARLQGDPILFITEKPTLFLDFYRDIENIDSLDLFQNPFVINNNIQILDQQGNPVGPNKGKAVADSIDWFSHADPSLLLNSFDIVVGSYSQFNRAAPSETLLNAASRAAQSEDIIDKGLQGDYEVPRTTLVGELLKLTKNLDASLTSKKSPQVALRKQLGVQMLEAAEYIPDANALDGMSPEQLQSELVAAHGLGADPIAHPVLYTYLQNIKDDSATSETFELIAQHLAKGLPVRGRATIQEIAAANPGIGLSELVSKTEAGAILQAVASGFLYEDAELTTQVPFTATSTPTAINISSATGDFVFRTNLNLNKGGGGGGLFSPALSRKQSGLDDHLSGADVFSFDDLLQYSSTASGARIMRTLAARTQLMAVVADRNIKHQANYPNKDITSGSTTPKEVVAYLAATSTAASYVPTISDGVSGADPDIFTVFGIDSVGRLSQQHPVLYAAALEALSVEDRDRIADYSDLILQSTAALKLWAAAAAVYQENLAQRYAKVAASAYYSSTAYGFKTAADPAQQLSDNGQYPFPLSNQQEEYLAKLPKSVIPNLDLFLMESPFKLSQTELRKIKMNGGTHKGVTTAVAYHIGMAGEMRAQLDLAIHLMELPEDKLKKVAALFVGRAAELMPAPPTLSGAEARALWADRAVQQGVLSNTLGIFDESHIVSNGKTSRTSQNLWPLTIATKGMVYSSATSAKKIDSLQAYTRLFPSEWSTPTKAESLSQALRKGGAPLQESLATILAQDGRMIRREHDLSSLTINTLAAKDDVLTRNVAVADEISEVVKEINDISGLMAAYVQNYNHQQWLLGNASGAAANTRSQSRGQQIEYTSFSSKFYQLNRAITLMLNADMVAEQAIADLRNGIKPVIAVDNTMESLLVEVLDKQRLVSINIEDEADIALAADSAATNANTSSAKIDTDVEIKEGDTDTIATDLSDEEVDALLSEVAAESASSLSVAELADATIPKGIKLEGKVTVGVLLQRYASNALLLKDVNGNYINPADIHPRLPQLYEDLALKIQALPELSAAPLDVVRNKIEAAGFSVGELTGRKLQLTIAEDGTEYLTKRAAVKREQLTGGFNSGEIDALIISRTGSTGISLHAGTAFKNQQPRNLIELQPAADIVQRLQFWGRVNRLDQVCSPSITLTNSGLPAETRLQIMQNNHLRRMSANISGNADSSSVDTKVPDLLNAIGNHVCLQWLSANKEMADRLGFTQGTIAYAIAQLGLKDETEDLSENVIDMEMGTAWVDALTGRMMLLKVEEQHSVYAQLADGFNKEMERFAALGKNPLKSDQLAWGATIINQRCLDDEELSGSANALSTTDETTDMEVQLLRSAFDEPCYLTDVEYKEALPAVTPEMIHQQLTFWDVQSNLINYKKTYKTSSIIKNVSANVSAHAEIVPVAAADRKMPSMHSADEIEAYCLKMREVMSKYVQHLIDKSEFADMIEVAASKNNSVSGASARAILKADEAIEDCISRIQDLAIPGTIFRKANTGDVCMVTYVALPDLDAIEDKLDVEIAQAKNGANNKNRLLSGGLISAWNRVSLSSFVDYRMQSYNMTTGGRSLQTNWVDHLKYEVIAKPEEFETTPLTKEMYGAGFSFVTNGKIDRKKGEVPELAHSLFDYGLHRFTADTAGGILDRGIAFAEAALKCTFGETGAHNKDNKLSSVMLPKLTGDYLIALNEHLPSGGEATHVRTLITGNAFKAATLAAAKNTGRLVSYSDEKGTWHRGILLPKSLENVVESKNNTGLTFTASSANQWPVQVSKKFLTDFLSTNVFFKEKAEAIKDLTEQMREETRNSKFTVETRNEPESLAYQESINIKWLERAKLFKELTNTAPTSAGYDRPAFDATYSDAEINKVYTGIRYRNGATVATPKVYDNADHTKARVVISRVDCKSEYPAAEITAIEIRLPLKCVGSTFARDVYADPKIEALTYNGWATMQGDYFANVALEDGVELANIIMDIADRNGVVMEAPSHYVSFSQACAADRRKKEAEHAAAMANSSDGYSLVDSSKVVNSPVEIARQRIAELRAIAGTAAAQSSQPIEKDATTTAPTLAVALARATAKRGVAPGAATDVVVGTDAVGPKGKEEEASSPEDLLAATLSKAAARRGPN